MLRIMKAPVKAKCGSKSKAAMHTANVNRQTADKLLFSYAIITGENV